VDELAPLNQDAPFTSHHMREIFQGTAEYKGKKERFHPNRRFRSEYSESAPDFALTYTWDTDFRKEMPEYFSNIQKVVDSSQGPDKYTKRFEDMTFWLDIFFIDQNDSALIDKLISDSSQIYTSASHHCVLLAFDTLRRGWCLVEIGYRAYGIMAEFRLKMKDLQRMLSGKAEEKEHYSVKVLQKVSEASIISHRLPQIIFGTSSDLTKDLFPFMASEILDNMKTSNESDRPRILEILTQLFEEKAAFDSVIHEFATGGIALVAKGLNGVRKPPPSPTLNARHRDSRDATSRNLKHIPQSEAVI
jgi:hypothetical protein